MTARRRDILCLLAGFFLLYSITAPGNLTGDTEIRWQVAQRLLDTGWVDLGGKTTNLSAQGTDGLWYSFYGPGQSLCLILFVLAGRGLAALAPPGGADLMGQFLASTILFPLFGAAAVAMLYFLVLDATGEARLARRAAIVLGAATMFWHNSINTYEESQIALCALTALWAAERFRERRLWGYLLLAMSACGAAACFRISSVVVLGPLMLAEFGWDVFASKPAARRVLQWLGAAAIGAGPLLVALGAYNVARFGSPWQTGYAPAHAAFSEPVRLFQTPLLTGLGGQLVSPGKSVFLFNPILILCVIGLVQLWRTHRPLALSAACALAATILFHARYTYWSGDLAWGPRYMASVMGLFVLGMVPVLQWRRGRWLVAALIVVSVIVQMASVTYSFGLEFAQDRRHGTIPDEYVWDIRQSQLPARFRNIALHAMGRPNLTSMAPARERPDFCQVHTGVSTVAKLHAVNFYPFKARAMQSNSRLAGALLALWLAQLAALAATILVYVRGANDPAKPTDESKELEFSRFRGRLTAWGIRLRAAGSSL